FDLGQALRTILLLPYAFHYKISNETPPQATGLSLLIFPFHALFVGNPLSAHRGISSFNPHGIKIFLSASSEKIFYSMLIPFQKIFSRALRVLDGRT
ncbi:MAG: hypothetical protein K2J72_00075, partial [Oscillospiraceae bacterium]|nr:hypothetical protein [Oscillospiraceae bacterium]